ncbi:DUF2339 domain-containing protein [Acinetobacter sp. A3.8]|uniref:DUF2339 domain-containing protein n=1 Tax=Acinetobacter sedimenti TaxID=2919922 RepID=A0A9X2B6U0_9GAMM|nr:DUF2339 domain-containing protein [Acinetobacter sedimenti]MCJ8147023.1 DUF2339 domain-containing protein [Acinetobacter sedimenti]
MTNPNTPNHFNKSNDALHTQHAQTTSLFRFPDAIWARILLIIFAILFLGQLVFGGEADILWWLALLGSVILACNAYENQNMQIKQLQQSTFQLQQQVDRLSQGQIHGSNSAIQVDVQRDASIEESKEVVAETNSFPEQVSPSFQNESIVGHSDLKNQNTENISTELSTTDSATSDSTPAWMNANTTQTTEDLHSDHLSNPSEKVSPSNTLKHDELKTMTSMWDATLNWFKGGNSIVRIAVVILLIGVVLLLRFASEYWQLTISAKMAGIGACAIALTGLGYFLRQRRFDYAISLQGLGLGVLFLVLFSSFHLGVIQSVTLSYVALIAILATTLWLAIRQNALILAFIALGSGFIAPFILNTGSNNIPALMAYFFVLNLALAIIAYFKPWRILNTLGLLITFGLGGFAIWSKAEDTQAFQIACWVWAIFAIYLFISIRYSQHIVALKTQFKDIPYIDTSLIFATPFMAFSLYAGLVSSDGYALSIASAVLASVYLVLAYILHQKAKQLLILTQCFYGLGFVFLALILPFAFDAYWSSVGWAIHGLVMLWLGWRYAIVNARYFGVALLLASGVATLYVVLFNNQSALFAGCLLMASYAIATYLLLHPKAETDHQTDTSNPTALASICGMTLLLLSLILAPVNYFYAMDEFYGLDLEWISLPLLLWTFVLYLGYGFFAKSQTHFLWKISAFIVLAITAFETLIGNVGYELEGKSYLAMTYHGGYEWYALMGSAILCLIIFAMLIRDTVFKNKSITSSESSNSHFLNATVQIYTAVAVLMLAILGGAFANENSYVAMLAVLPIITFVLSYFVKKWHHWQSLWVGNFAVIAVLWYWLVTVSFAKDGAWSLPFVPVLNPIDLVSIIVFVILTFALKPYLLSASRAWQFASASVLLGTGIILVSSLLLRVLTHYAGLPYWLDGAWQNGTVQASLTILWTLIALILTTLASRQSWRYIWMLGIAVLGLVIFKLIFLDLSQSQTLTRIISFIGSGLIMLVIGYFSPLPPTNKRLGE